MKKLYFLILLFSSILVQAQERYFLNSDTRLFTSPNASADFLGYFKYGAEVHLLSENQNGWYKIKADNLNEGYVQEKFVVKSLNSQDVKIRDPKNPIIEGGDAYYGGNHLFILAAGLKARALPDKNSKIREIQFTGDPVAVNYVPLNPDEWVNISGSIDEKYAQFTLRKFLGPRPDFDFLLKDFDKLDTNNLTERKTVSERIVELAWNSNYSSLIPAYQRYYEVVKQINDPKLIAETELNITIAKGLAKHKLPEEITAFLKNSEFILKGIKTKGFFMSLSDLLKIFGKPLRTESNSDGCGIYTGDTFYYYTELETSIDKKLNQAEIISVRLNENNKFKINQKSILDNSISEKAFIEKYGTYIDASIKSPHLYSFSVEDSSYRVEFKDGKLFAITIFYYC